MSNNNQEERIFSVREGIQFCIKNKIKGAKEQLESFDKNGKLATNQKITLQKNLECLADEVVVTGGGKSGQVILRGLKDSPTERITGNANNGRKLSDNDHVMKEYLFSLLCRRSLPNTKEIYTINALVNMVDYLPLKWMIFPDVKRELDTIFANYYYGKQTAYIMGNILWNISNRVRSDLQLYLNHLEKEEKIKVKTIYNAKYHADAFSGSSNKNKTSYAEIHEDIFNMLKKEIEQIAITHNYTYKDYVQSKIGFKKLDDSFNKMIEKVKEYLRGEGYDYIFISNEVEILRYETSQHNINEEAEKEKAENAFVKKLILITNKRMQKESYKNKTNFIREFYRLAMFVFLRAMGVKGLDKKIKEEISLVKPKCEDMFYSYTKNKLEVEKNEELWAFGNNSKEVDKNKRGISTKIDTPKIQVENIKDYVESVKVNEEAKSTDEPEPPKEKKTNDEPIGNNLIVPDDYKP